MDVWGYIRFVLDVYIHMIYQLYQVLQGDMGFCGVLPGCLEFI